MADERTDEELAEALRDIAHELRYEDMPTVADTLDEAACHLREQGGERKEGWVIAEGKGKHGAWYDFLHGSPTDKEICRRATLILHPQEESENG